MELLDLPFHLLELIALQLPPVDVGHLAQTSKRLLSLLEERFWSIRRQAHHCHLDSSTCLSSKKLYQVEYLLRHFYQEGADQFLSLFRTLDCGKSSFFHPYQLPNEIRVLSTPISCNWQWQMAPLPMVIVTDDTIQLVPDLGLNLNFYLDCSSGILHCFGDVVVRSHRPHPINRYFTLNSMSHLIGTVYTLASQGYRPIGHQKIPAWVVKRNQDCFI